MSDAKNLIDAAAAEFLRRQQVFFVATAPLAADGRVNLSPKGLDTSRVQNETQVACADVGGS